MQGRDHYNYIGLVYVVFSVGKHGVKTLESMFNRMCIIRPLPASQTYTTQNRNRLFYNILISKYRTAQFTMDTTFLP